MVEWQYTNTPLVYEESLSVMERRVADIRAGHADELVWLLEHPPLYTGGTSANASDLLDAQFPVYETGRGGQYTYHGPGQRVAYVMLNLKKRSDTPDIRQFVKQLEHWLINSLAAFDIEAFTREGRIGVWVNVEHPYNANRASADAPLQSPSGVRPMARNSSAAPGQTNQKNEKKIGALGIRVRQWVTFHGIALNVNPDLSHYAGIVPCGISEFGVTSMHEMGKQVAMAEVDAVLKREFEALFT